MTTDVRAGHDTPPLAAPRRGQRAVEIALWGAGLVVLAYAGYAAVQLPPSGLPSATECTTLVQHCYAAGGDPAYVPLAIAVGVGLLLVGAGRWLSCRRPSGPLAASAEPARRPVLLVAALDVTLVFLALQLGGFLPTLVLSMVNGQALVAWQAVLWIVATAALRRAAPQERGTAWRVLVPFAAFVLVPLWCLFSPIRAEGDAAWHAGLLSLPVLQAGVVVTATALATCGAVLTRTRQRLGVLALGLALTVVPLVLLARVGGVKPLADVFVAAFLGGRFTDPM